MKKQNLLLYAYTFRSRAERVIWTLNELELDYKIKRLDPFKGETFTEDFLQLNPSAKIPVLVHGDRTLTESLAIMEYLNELSGEISLIPNEVESSIRFRNLVYYMATELEPYLWIADQATRLKMLYEWPEGTSDASIKRVKKNIGYLLTKVVDYEFAAGDAFTIADIYAFQILSWSHSYGIQLPQNIFAYLFKLAQRPGFPPEMKPKFINNETDSFF